MSSLSAQPEIKTIYKEKSDSPPLDQMCKCKYSKLSEPMPFRLDSNEFKTQSTSQPFKDLTFSVRNSLYK